MKIKIICGQLEVIPGRPDLNYKKILTIIDAARSQQADILLLPEMCLPGYLIGDLWEQQAFLDDCAYYTEQIIAASRNICVIFGSVAVEQKHYNEDGRVRKYNAAFACCNGKPAGGYLGRDFFIKNSLPNYREFDDSRHFYSLQKLCADENMTARQALQPLELTLRGQKLRLGILLCEDSWTENYQLNVPQILADNGAQLLCNLSCSPFALGKNAKRQRLFSSQANQTGLPLIYCNNTGIQNNGKNIFTYDGCSSAYNIDGQPAAEAAMFNEQLLAVEWDTERNTLSSCSACTPAKPLSETAVIYSALKYGTQKFLQQFGIHKMTIGLSGGIDSAVTAAMYADILGPENILLLNLPSRYNSSTTRTIAQILASALGSNYSVLPITESCELTMRQLQNTPITNLGSGHQFNLQLSALAQENIQARDRGARLIAAAAASFGGAFSCNSNKTELSVGYATFYGDIAGALAMLGDLWKYQVYALGHYLNEQVFARQVIPEEIFDIRPSAELSDAQTVGNGGDPLFYPYHDYLLRSFIESWNKTTPADILRWYMDGLLEEKLGCSKDAVQKACPTPQAFVEDLERWWKLFSGFAVAKRIQAPPVLSISKRAFGYDHREAQLTPYFSREYYQLRQKLLQK